VCYKRRQPATPENGSRLRFETAVKKSEQPTFLPPGGEKARSQTLGPVRSIVSGLGGRLASLSREGRLSGKKEREPRSNGQPESTACNAPYRQKTKWGGPSPKDLRGKVSAARTSKKKQHPQPPRAKSIFIRDLRSADPLRPGGGKKGSSVELQLSKKRDRKKESQSTTGTSRTR